MHTAFRPPGVPPAYSLHHFRNGHRDGRLRSALRAETAADERSVSEQEILLGLFATACLPVCCSRRSIRGQGNMRSNGPFDQPCFSTRQVCFPLLAIKRHMGLTVIQIPCQTAMRGRNFLSRGGETLRTFLECT
jgi:hypothetical protein